MERLDLMLILVGMGGVTFLPRWIPLFFLSGRRLPPIVIEWLELIPVAVLSALLLPELVTAGEPRRLDLFRPELLVAIPTFGAALASRSLGLTVVVGMGLYWVVGKI
jgi:branched-subunit amino acid transport protein